MKNYNSINLVNLIFHEIIKKLLEIISQKLIILIETFTEIEIICKKDYLLTILMFLKNHSLSAFKQLIEIAVIDNISQTDRFKVNYILFSVKTNMRFIISVYTNEIEMIFSSVHLYNSAEWLEREVWDLYGIHFDGNRNLRRILTDYGFKGHPLRKDFPLTGFLEIYYNDEEKKIIYEPVELAQEFRVFSLRNPWLHTSLISESYINGVEYEIEDEKKDDKTESESNKNIKNNVV
jgi:NADH-quinone oxidoreductase subunit C